jgi:CBS domain-containing protein
MTGPLEDPAVGDAAAGLVAARQHSRRDRGAGAAIPDPTLDLFFQGVLTSKYNPLTRGTGGEYARRRAASRDESRVSLLSDGQRGTHMMTVRELLEQKGGVVWTIGPNMSVFEAIKTMAEKGIGALVVMEGSELVGIISERDYARKVVLQGKSSKGTSCREIMTGKVFFVTPERTLDECMALMTEKRIRHLPVIESKKLIGIVSIGDCIKAIVSKQEFIIEQLENYIRGG